MSVLQRHPANSEVPDLSAVRRPVPAPMCPKVPAAEVLRDLRAADTSWAALGMRRPVAPTQPAPLTLTDWSKKLAWTWAYAESAIAVCIKDAKAMIGSDRNAVGALFAPLFADLVDLAAEIDDDRGALCGHVNAERVLLSDLAPAADALVQKAGVER